jgi:carbon starvation protein
VRDEHGGINSLWPLFGIANQMLANIALCLVTTIVLKMQLGNDEAKVQASKRKAGTPALALVTLLPLVWLLAVTMTAGVEKIWHPDPRIGFLAHSQVLNQALPELERVLTASRAAGETQAIEAAEMALRTNRVLHFNDVLDAMVASVFLVLVGAIVLLSVREWLLLLARRKLAVLRESEPVWLPDYALAEAKSLHLASLLALAFALARELSGEAQLERARQAEQDSCGQEACNSSENQRHIIAGGKSDQRRYLEITEQRFNGVRRCC